MRSTKTYNLEEATRVYNEDILWLNRAGFLKDNDWDKNVMWPFMQGKVNLHPDIEINILRRIERAIELGFWIDYSKTDKAKFRT
jgi:hypothetical protein